MKEGIFYVSTKSGFLVQNGPRGIHFYAEVDIRKATPFKTFAEADEAGKIAVTKMFPREMQYFAILSPGNDFPEFQPENTSKVMNEEQVIILSMAASVMSDEKIIQAIEVLHKEAARRQPAKPLTVSDETIKFMQETLNPNNIPPDERSRKISEALQNRDYWSADEIDTQDKK